MRVLAVTNMYPSAADPVYGSFVARQMRSIVAAGAEVEILFVDGRRGKWAYPEAIRRVAAVLRNRHFDVVHAHYGLTGFFAGFHRRPLVVSFCGDDLLGSPDGRGGTRLVSRVARRLSDLAARRADAVICKSESLRTALIREVDRKRAHVIANGIDVTLFKPGDKGRARNQLGLPSTERLILFPHSRRESAMKRFDLAEEATVELRRRGIAARLWVVNGVNPDEMPAYYQASDCLLLTSVHEGSPNVVKEALACDLPVVATDVGDVRRWTELAQGCRLVAAYPAHVADGLEAVLKSPGRVDGLAIRNALNQDVVARAIMAVYAEAIATRRSWRAEAIAGPLASREGH